MPEDFARLNRLARPQRKPLRRTQPPNPQTPKIKKRKKILDRFSVQCYNTVQQDQIFKRGERIMKFLRETNNTMMMGMCMGSMCMFLRGLNSGVVSGR